jgi:hypothetical protein
MYPNDHFSFSKINEVKTFEHVRREQVNNGNVQNEAVRLVRVRGTSWDNFSVFIHPYLEYLWYHHSTARKRPCCITSQSSASLLVESSSI